MTTLPSTEKQNKFTKLLPLFVMIIFALQPLMDILSYWTGKLGITNALTLLLRFGVLGLVALFGFISSKNKGYYFIMAGVCALLFCGHIYACEQVGYLGMVSDATNYIRVLQMPLFALCFISFVRANEKCFDSIENGLILCFWIIAVSVAISVITGTYSPTYEDSGYGVLGWFATSNAQSSILSILTPIVVSLMLYRKKNILIFSLTAAAAFAQLYFLGTRLAFLSIFVTVGGIIIVMLVTKSFSIKHVAILLCLTAICCLFVKQSPMYLNQNRYNTVMASKQSDSEVMKKWAEEQEEEEEEEEKKSGKKKGELTEEELEERRLKALKVVYRYYSRKLVARFGVDAVMEKYDYTQTITEITATRQQKITYCELLLDEHSFASRLFGMELDRMTCNGFNFDVENDFHGIYFLFGGFGLLLLGIFIGYFIVIVIKALIKDFKLFFTAHTAGYGMALMLSLVYAYQTAGVLRRPNSSFYLSVVLAVIFCLVKVVKTEVSQAKQMDNE